MDSLLTEDFINDYRTEFGLDNAALEFDVSFGSLLGPPVAINSNVKSGGGGGVEQTLPDSPPDSSGSPPSSVYSPTDHRHQQARKRTRRNSDEDGGLEAVGQVDGTVLCDLMLGEAALKDKDLARYSGNGNSGTSLIAMVGQCPYSNPQDDIKPPLMIPNNAATSAIQGPPEPFQVQQQPIGHNNNANYHQLTAPGSTGYYINYVDFDADHSYNGEPGSSNGQDDLYSHHQLAQPHIPQQQQPSHTFVEMPVDGHLNNSGGSENILMASPDPMQSQQPQHRKRKLAMDSFEDASPGASATPDSQYNTSDRGMAMTATNSGDGGSNGDGSLPGTPMQCIRFEPFQSQLWHPLCDHQLQDLPMPHYRVDADKGFNFSASDDAFVCQKKNHFQVTCHTQLIGFGAVAAAAAAATAPGTTAAGAIPATTAFNVIFVRTQNGLEKVRNFCLHFYGVKFEAPRHMIRVEQSQSDRSKKAFHPVVIDLHCGQISKTTIGRLHFSETTSNNMRKKGRPNPEQRYFRLVVALHAHTHTGDYPIVAHGSEKIIVRASNPGQFENDFELCWQRGITPDSIFHNGKIGLNTDQPDECLVVNGNLKVTGHILQPSDCRIKRELTELSTRQQLENIEKIRIVKFAYQDGVAAAAGRGEATTGVMAQEVRQVLPDAVFEQQTAYQLANGAKLDKFLVVNKDRIFLENVGAVKELSKVTGKLERRIQQLEISQGEMAARHQRDLSLLPTSLKGGGKLSWEQGKLGNHSLQCIILILIVVMTVCLSTLVTLYFMEHYDSARNYRQMNQQRRSHEQSAGGPSKEGEAIALNYTLNDKGNDLQLHGLLKPGKKNTMYKIENGGQNRMSLSEDAFAAANGGAAEEAHNLGPNSNWNNVEFVLLYISKLQQYINEVQKTSKGKLQQLMGGNEGATANGNGAPSDGSSADGNGETANVQNDGFAIDFESAEAAGGETADETNLATGAEAEPMVLNSKILSLSNRSSSTEPPPSVENNPVLQKPKKKNPTSDKSAIDHEYLPAQGDLSDVGQEDSGDPRQPPPPQEPDIENLINSNK